MTVVGGRDNTIVTIVDNKRDDRKHLQLVVFGNGTFATHPLPDRGLFTIGRSSACEIAIDDGSISRRHAILSIGAGTLMIEDLGSANGTRVRGAKIKFGQPVPIAIGELVEVGKASVILQQRALPARARTLWTHDYFEARIEEECAKEQRAGTGFALLRIHTDPRAGASFVEDTLGELVRDSDVLGKYGPHEYEVLLPDTTAAHADEAVGRLEARLRERGLEWRIFAACCPRDGRSPHQLTAKVQAVDTDKPPAASTANDIVVVDTQMQSLYRMVEQVAASQIGVLLLGETGVGKEVFARAVHRASPRSKGPFVEINCAALTETLLESELFGHEKGAFTNATSAKPGLIEMADGGTLLLDEIGDMPPTTQAKLLRVLEDKQLRRVGGLKPRSIDVRVVAATNSDLEAQMESGAFRRDLYFRLNGVTLVIPPLRERLADIEPLARGFLAKGSRREAPELTAEALEVIRSYSWPGNVRELKHAMERAVLLSKGLAIRPEHLPVEKMRATLIPNPMLRTGAVPRARGPEEEQQRILEALDRANGNQTVAARLLGISRRTLVNRLNEYDHVHRPRKHKKTRPKP